MINNVISTILLAEEFIELFDTIHQGINGGKRQQGGSEWVWIDHRSTDPMLEVPAMCEDFSQQFIFHDKIYGKGATKVHLISWLFLICFIFGSSSIAHMLALHSLY